jgi:hypothetical protein
MMARSTNTPCKGRIQMRKTNPLHFFTFGLQRTAGPYRWVNRDTLTLLPAISALARGADILDGKRHVSNFEQAGGRYDPGAGIAKHIEVIARDNVRCETNSVFAQEITQAGRLNI